MNNQKDSQDLRILIEKYLDGEINFKELKKIFNYYESFQLSNEWVEELGSENAIKDKMLSNILKSIDEDIPKIKPLPFYKKSVFKYAVAAAIALLISLYFIFDKDVEHVVNEPSVIDSKSISIGTDKAILTLEDGSQVSLKKGQSLKTANAKSNGREIIYEAKASTKSKIAYNYLTIPRGGQFYVKLSDGTQVWLNSESQLKYPVNFIPGQTREVELVYGEAYFDVSQSKYHKGTTFKVKSEFQSVNVTGTKFNVKAYNTENEIVTTLVEGKVEIEKNNNCLFLNPDQQSILHKDNNWIDVNNVDAIKQVSWIKGLYTFEDASLLEIMNTLSRWYDFKVVFKNSEKQKYVFTGVLERTKSIQNIMKNLQATGDVDFEINNKTIEIK